ncbi:MAG: hypothetical protein HQL46_15100 [Gammaproteobacteria bacterium]|nr:hypothetical protein [Gammaproteobacteria bacterium]
MTYLLASRGIETLDIRLSHCTKDGIKVHRRKGSKDNIVQWTPRLKKAYFQAIRRHSEYTVVMLDPYLIIGTTGGKLNKSTLNTAMQRLKKRMIENGKGDSYWSLHLLKSKGISDAEDKNLGGHKSEQMKERYNTKVEEVRAAK